MFAFLRPYLGAIFIGVLVAVLMAYLTNDAINSLVVALIFGGGYQVLRPQPAAAHNDRIEAALVSVAIFTASCAIPFLAMKLFGTSPHVTAIACALAVLFFIVAHARAQVFWSSAATTR